MMLDFAPVISSWFSIHGWLLSKKLSLSMKRENLPLMSPAHSNNIKKCITQLCLLDEVKIEKLSRTDATNLVHFTAPSHISTIHLTFITCYVSLYLRSFTSWSSYKIIICKKAKRLILAPYDDLSSTDACIVMGTILLFLIYLVK